MIPRKKKGDNVSVSQNRGPVTLSETVRAKKKTSNKNLVQGKQTDTVHTVTSYFDPVWTVFSKHTDGSLQWIIPKQIVTIGTDFHSQVGDEKVRSTLYKVWWEGYD